MSEEEVGEKPEREKKGQVGRRHELNEIRVRSQAANETLKRARNERKELKSRLDALIAEHGKITPEAAGKRRRGKSEDDASDTES